MTNRWCMMAALVAALVSVGGFGLTTAGAKDDAQVRFGALPVLQALPLYVAQEKGLFAK